MRRVRFALRVLRAAIGLQFALLNVEGLLMTIVIPPVIWTIFLVLLVQYTGRTEFAVYAVLGPALLGAWGTVLTASGNVVNTDRWEGTLELVFTSPAGAWLVFLGRVFATSFLAVISFVETVVVAALLGVRVDLSDPALLLVALAVILASVGGAGLITAGWFVLARDARLYTNLLPIPLLILTGAAFPVALLPEPAQWLSHLIALKWGAELLRVSVGVGSADALVPFVMTVALTAAYVVTGRRVFALVERRVRADGTLSSYE